MAISLAEAARRLGFESTKAEQSESTAPIALTPEQIAEGMKGYQKYLADVDSNIPNWAKKHDPPQGNRYAQIVANDYNTFTNVDTSLASVGENWSDEEKARFGLEYLNNGKESARNYAITVNEAYKKKEAESKNKTIADFATKNVGTGALASVGSVLTAPTALIDYLDQLGENALYGRPVEHGVTAFTAGQTATEAISKKLNEYGTINDDVFMLGGKGWGDVYNLGMSIANSTASAATLGGIGTLVNFFGQSASRAYSDAYARGASSGQAILYSVLMGAAEAIPEMISADKLLGIGKEATKSLFKQVLSQAGEEAGEETTTALLELVIDKMVFGENSIDILKQNYIAKGLYST